MRDADKTERRMVEVSIFFYLFIYSFFFAGKKT